MEKLAKTSGLVAIISVAAGPALAEREGHGHGGGAPAPEIGAGVVGVLLAMAAVRYFRQRTRG
ncbi:hypothetical protein DSM21852_29250 [Methylocystis bryophila]|uniref:Uncharacterized protein n=1 Tax=Methylocystis bryophila TaxID=655015 RepID=A0A1W6MQB3_9HYPH|nr:hypothetical protein B1812_00480 [Methylocystis bryophila]BDV39672.1 hypothetical protein DSM21852_29250 [Methylocystis bryophila]